MITHESTFSVTGFLTFAVVSATAVANVIANINNNNDNNNNNQDNVNNNNQVSNSDDAKAFHHEKTNFWSLNINLGLILVDLALCYPRILVIKSC